MQINNPYSAPNFKSPRLPKRRAVGCFVFASVVSTLLAIVLLLPVAVLLNQEWQLVPTTVFFSEFTVSGLALSSHALLRILIVSSGLLLVGSATSSWMGMRNAAVNRTIAKSLEAHS